MKKVILIIISVIIITGLNAQNNENNIKPDPTSVGIILYSNDAETIFNAMRLANYSVSQGDTVKIFLLGKGVETDIIVKENKDVKEQVDEFLDNGGHILGCGTCLHSRKNDEPQICHFSSLKDLYDLIRQNKIVLTF